jgi:hypothetical protein
MPTRTECLKRACWLLEYCRDGATGKPRCEHFPVCGLAGKPKLLPDNEEVWRVYNLCKAGVVKGVDYDNAPAWLVTSLATLDAAVSAEMASDMKDK